MVMYINNIYRLHFLRKENMFRRKGVLIMQKKNLSRIALSGLLALSMVPAASMQIYADNKTAEESTSGGGKNK